MTPKRLAGGCSPSLPAPVLPRAEKVGCRFLSLGEAVSCEPVGRIELDNNTVERAIRPIALGRKNHLFAGSDGGAERWAIVASLLATAKLNDVEPFAYLRDVLECLSDGHPMSRLDDLLPWNWIQLKAAA